MVGERREGGGGWRGRGNLDASMRNTTSEEKRKHKRLPAASKMEVPSNHVFDNKITLVHCAAQRHLLHGCCIFGSLDSHTPRFLTRMKHMHRVLRE